MAVDGAVRASRGSARTWTRVGEGHAASLRVGEGMNLQLGRQRMAAVAVAASDDPGLCVAMRLTP